MKHDYEYENENVMLRPLEWADIEELRILRNRERHCFLNAQLIEKESQIKWYESYLQKGNDIMFKVVKTTKPEEFIGAVAIYNINYEDRTAEFGRLVIDKERAPEKGIGKETVLGICKFSFDVLKLHRICAVVLKNNEKALRTYIKVGFKMCKESMDCYVVDVTEDMIYDKQCR